MAGFKNNQDKAWKYQVANRKCVLNRLLETKKYEEGKMEDCKRLYA